MFSVYLLRLGLAAESCSNGFIFSDMASKRVQLKYSHHELFHVWCSEVNNDNKNRGVYMYIVEKLNVEHNSENFLRGLKKRCDNFCAYLKLKWTQAYRCKKTFYTKNKTWLNKDFEIGDPSRDEAKPSTSKEPESVTKGRPKKLFIEGSDKTKQRRVAPIVAEHSPEELTFAAGKSLRSQGKRDAAMMMAEIMRSPRRATKIKKVYKRQQNELPQRISNERALALFVDNKMTKKQYVSVRLLSKDHNANIYPSYKEILQTKEQCYPSEIIVSEKCAEIKLQSLIDHTVRRLVAVQYDVIKQYLTTRKVSTSPLSVIFKWGCDGSSGHSRYKQKWTEEHDTHDNDDSCMFAVSMVPIRLFATNNDGDSIVLWQNQRASSTWFCRPIKVMFAKEDAELTRKEVEQINAQISLLVPTTVVIEEHNINIQSKLILTMVDGKICNALSETSAASVCYICGAKPTQMNKLELIKTRNINEEFLTFGISPLHAWIRSLECFLHIAYRIDIKCWKVQKKDKERVEQRKRYIQEKLKEDLGLLVDIPKPGSGTTNDGNSARIFFNNPQTIATITSLKQDILERFAVILKTIASGFAINIEAFEAYTTATAELYIRHYNWYYMPVTIHKILMHGSLIIKSAILPIGMFSEEAQEARNKDLRSFREHHARKFSRKQNLEDVIHLLLISSDPVISSRRQLPARKKGSFSKEVLSLLEDPSLLISSADNSSDDDDNYLDSDDD